MKKNAHELPVAQDPFLNLSLSLTLSLTLSLALTLTLTLILNEKTNA